MEPIDEQIIKDKLQHMFHDRTWFCISDFDAIMELANQIPPEKTYKRLHALHCRHWRSMDPILRRDVFNMVMSCFDIEHAGFPQITMQVIPKPIDPPTLAQRLLGR